MTAVGKFNPNSTIKEYVQDLRAAQLSPTSESDVVCIQIANILPRDEYLAWVDAGPESNAAFLKYAQDKLNALTKNPDTTLREIANNLGVTAVHCSDGLDLQDDTELAAAVRAVHGEAQELDWMTEARAQMADAKDLERTQDDARL